MVYVFKSDCLTNRQHMAASQVMMALGATDGPVEKNFSLNSQAMSHDEYRGDIDDPRSSVDRV